MTEYEPGDTVRVSREIVVKGTDEEWVWGSGSSYRLSDYDVQLVKKAVHNFTDDPLGTMYENRNNPTERWIKIPSNSANWIMRRIDEPGWFDSYDAAYSQFAENLKPVDTEVDNQSGSWWDNEDDEWRWVKHDDGGWSFCMATFLRSDGTAEGLSSNGRSYNELVERYGPLRRNK